MLLSPPPRTLALMLETDGPGGAESVLLQLAEGLRRRGHRVLPVGLGCGSGWLLRRLERSGFEPVTLRMERRLDLRLLRELTRLLRERGVDLVHSHEFAFAVYGAAAALRAGLPHVITMHGGRYHAGSLRRRLALRWAVRRSAATVAVSSAFRSVLAQDLALAPARMRVVPNGVAAAEGDGRGVRAELGLEPEELLLLAVGNLYPVKGHRVLLGALERLHRAHPRLRWRLAVAGRGEEERPLLEMAERAGLRERVHLLGLRDDVPDLLDAADVFVLPSLSEGLPLALLEAMHAQRPVVASRVGGIPEAVEDGRDAMLVPPGDAAALERALACVLQHPPLRRRLGAGARGTARERFSLEAMIDGYEALYGEALGSAAAPASREARRALRRRRPAGVTSGPPVAGESRG